MNYSNHDRNIPYNVALQGGSSYSMNHENEPQLKTKAYINPQIINYGYIKNSAGSLTLPKPNKIHVNPNFKKNQVNAFGKNDSEHVQLAPKQPLPPQLSKTQPDSGLSKLTSPLRKMPIRQSTSKYKIINVNNVRSENFKSSSSSSSKVWFKDSGESHIDNKCYKKINNKTTTLGDKQLKWDGGKSKNLSLVNVYNSKNAVKLSSDNNFQPRFVSRTKIINSNKKIINNIPIKSTVKNLASNKISPKTSKYVMSSNKKLLLKVASSVRNKYKYNNKSATCLKIGTYKIDKRKLPDTSTIKQSVQINDIRKLFHNAYKPKLYYTNIFLKSHKKLNFSVPKNSYLWRRSAVHNKTISSKCHYPNKKIVKIGGIMYKSTSNKLIRTKEMRKEKVNSSSKKQNGDCKKKLKKNNYTVYVRGEKFFLDKNGKTLIRQTSSLSDEKVPATFRRIDIGGVTYLQKSKNVLIKTNLHQARHIVNSAKNKSIATLCQLRKKSALPCMIYHKFGKCNRHSKGLCMYKHDPKNIAICKSFLKGNCSNSNCLLSHETIKEKMAMCHFYLSGCCNRDNCPFLHVKLSDNADICEKFLQGFCELGQNCHKRHLFLCPEYDKKGKCSLGTKCPYPHKTKDAGNSTGQNSESTSENLQYYTKDFQLVPKSKCKVKVTKTSSSSSSSKVKDSKNQCHGGKLKRSKKKLRASSSSSSSLSVDVPEENLEVVPKRIKLDELPSFIPLGTNSSLP